MTILPHDFGRLEYNVDLQQRLVWHALGFFSIADDGNLILRGDSCDDDAQREFLKRGAQIAVADYPEHVRHVWA